MKHYALSEAKDILIKTAKYFHNNGWMWGTSGNLSICLNHEPIQYVITASGFDKGDLQSDNFVLCSEHQTPTEKTLLKPSAETALHEALYKLIPNIAAVYHIHTISSTTLSRNTNEDSLLFDDYEMLKGLGTHTHETSVSLPLIENTQDITHLANTLQQYLHVEVPGLMLKGHGLYTWGQTPHEAKQRVECWEFLFQCKLQELLLKAGQSLIHS